MTFKKITVIGAGNLGTPLAKVLHQFGFEIGQVFSRTPEKARSLAKAVSAEACTDLSKIKPDADLYILAVTDSAIGEVSAIVAKNHLPAHCLVVHTSGATTAEVFAPFFARYGIFYPLQTFSPRRKIDFAAVPVCVLANSPVAQGALRDLALQLSKYVYEIEEAQRQQLHLAAVFANNFTTRLVAIAQQITEEAALPIDLLRPLLAETFSKLQTLTAEEAQTGPARRGDQRTIVQHIRLLENNEPLQRIYQSLTDDIAQHFNQLNSKAE